jgi:isopenicillin N synthase-like dioxygenase
LQWHDVPYLKDAFVINLGDLMSRWTNDKWVSTPHRVVNPPLETDGVSRRRQSMAFFANLNMDAEVKAIPTCVDDTNPAKYPDTSAGEHLMAKHLASTQGILDDSWMENVLKSP